MAIASTMPAQANAEPPAKKAKISEQENGFRVTTKKMHIYTGPIEEPESFEHVALFAGNGNPALAQETSDFLGLPLSKIQCGKFADGEVNIKVNETVRGKDVYILQPSCRNEDRSVNDCLMELLLMISTMKRASARQITAVIPYYGYARQDRKMASRVPISAADVAIMITQMGVDRVICIDLHCGQIQGFFPPSVPVDHLSAVPVGAYYFAEKTDLVNPVVVAPDAGGVIRSKDFSRIIASQGLKPQLAMIIKQRKAANQIESMDLVGSVEGSDCIIVDDMVDTGGTLCEAAALLKKHKARRVMAFITHGLLNGPAVDRIAASCLDEVIVTNSVPLPDVCKVAGSKIKSLSIAPLLSEALRRTILQESGSNLFE